MRGWMWAAALMVLGTVVTLAQPDPGATSLWVEPASQDFLRNPDLLERIRSGPHGYFRFINIPFSREACRRIAALGPAPILNLHGDAHLEQYAVTDLGRGLTDFDDSSTGPGLIDILRFGVSLNLACRANGWDDQAEAMFTTFLDGYRDCLKDPDLEAAEPAVVARIRSGFSIDREAYFRWVESLMEPMREGTMDSLKTAMRNYVETRLLESPELGADFFRIERMGILKMGIGSALDLKFLVRIRGAAEDPLDDVVLEIKEVRDLSGIDCIQIGRTDDAFRILVGQTRIAYQPFHHLGYFRFRGRTFWVHSWVDNYKEVKLARSFQTPEELRQVARDVGVQLGKGHVKHIAAPLDLQLRRAQLRVLSRNHAAILTMVRDLTGATVTAWTDFVAALPEAPPN